MLLPREQVRARGICPFLPRRIHFLARLRAGCGVAGRYSKAIDYLLGRINYERIPMQPYQRGEFRLDRMRLLLRLLGNPQDEYGIVHITGTKGKGSTAALLSAILSREYLTGLYTSPHLERFEERIQINGTPCEPAEFVELVNLVRHPADQIDTDCAQARNYRFDSGPTYFELTTAMALLHFARRGCQLAVVEVGLGGRLDSTNVVKPLVSVITNISFDHTKQLGRTLAQIAYEKGGIIKPNTPIVSGVLANEPRQVITNIALRQNAPLSQLGQDFDFCYLPSPEIGTPARVDYFSRNSAQSNQASSLVPQFQKLDLGLSGRHQAANAALALATISRLQAAGWNVSTAAIEAGLANCRWPARIEVVRQNPLTILDAAHNEASIAALLETLRENYPGRQKWLIFATTREKPVQQMLTQVAGAFDGVILTQYAHNPRAYPLQQLQADFSEIVQRRAGKKGATPQSQLLGTAEGWEMTGYPDRGSIRPSTSRFTFRRKPLHAPRALAVADPATAWELAQNWAANDDVICITGSFFLAAELRSLVVDSHSR
ncbi:MAG: folylpolyglutamate synthase/dihydrofolate synthase family protein [Pirellulales bacterium]|nr:folylpolyglutamate synthase/dihydrofolate synthase family protein [Pirellulales bacterium]